MRATITPLSIPSVRAGHVAAWIGVGGPESAPGGSDWGLAHTLGGRAIVFPGGVPVFAGEHLVGGLGVSGDASAVDAACAALAVRSQGLDVDPEETS